MDDFGGVGAGREKGFQVKMRDFGCFRRAILAAALATPALGPGGRAYAQAPMKVLVVYGASDGGHSPMPLAGKPVLEKMGTTSNFTVEYNGDNKTALTDANLAKFDLLVMINQYPFDLGAPQQAALQKYIEAGRGWVGVHSTGCAQPSWPWFSTFLGNTTWKGHANLRMGTLLIEDHTHAVTKTLPASFQLKEEWYEFNTNPRPNVLVLAKAGPTGNAGYDGSDHPMVWCSKSYPKAVYISPGHDASDWNVPEYVTLVHDAIQWASPNPTVMAFKQAYLAPARFGRAWIRDGILQVEPEGQGRQPAVPTHLADARGRWLTLLTVGGSRYRIAEPSGGGRYFLSMTGVAGAIPVSRGP